MDDQEVKKAVGVGARRSQYVNVVTEAFESSRDYYANAYRAYGRWYRLFRAWKIGRAIPYRNQVTIPFLFGLIQSSVAKKVNLVLGTKPPVLFDGMGPEDQKIARKRTALVAAQLDDAETFDKATVLFTSGELFGTTPYKVFWDIRKELVSFRADLGTGEEAYSGEDTTFDGPNWEPMDVRDFFPQPGVARIAKMRWVVERFFLDLEDIHRLGEAGFFDKAGVADVAFDPLARSGVKDEELREATNPMSGMSEADTKQPQYDKPIEILQYWGRVPRALAVEGQVNLVITVASRKHLLRARPNPFGHIPIRELAPMPDPWHWHSASKVEVIEKLQVASNAMASQKVDILQLFADPQFLYNRRSAPPARRILARPGAWHPFDGPVGSENVQPLIPDLRGVNNLYQELEQQAQWMEQGTGIIRDAVQGLTGPDRETARAFLGRQQAANTRLLLEARIAETQWLEPLADEFVGLNRQFLTFPHQLKILGSSAVIDPITMMPVPMEGDFITVNEMLPDYTARAVGTLSGMSKTDQLQALMLMAPQLQSNPITLQLTNWFAFWRQAMTLAGIPNVDELMGTDAVMTQAVQEALGAMGGTGGLAQVAGPGGTQPAPSRRVA